MRFRYPEKYAKLIVSKGSICLNGVSLTVVDPTAHEFGVAIIPYTYENTNLKEIRDSSRINLEFDLVGKYILRNLLLRKD